MKSNTCPHPADACCEDPCPTTPNGFAFNATFVSSVDVSDVIGSPSNQKLRTEGRATATSLISKQDAIEKAIADAMAVAAARMDYLIRFRFP